MLGTTRLATCTPLDLSWVELSWSKSLIPRPLFCRFCKYELGRQGKALLGYGAIRLGY